MATRRRPSPQTIAVLQVLLATPNEPRYGYDIARAAGLKTGTVHPILARLQEAGWIDSFWEAPENDQSRVGPRRRYYRFTIDGVEFARSAIATAANAPDAHGGDRDISQPAVGQEPEGFSDFSDRHSDRWSRRRHPMVDAVSRRAIGLAASLLPSEERYDYFEEWYAEVLASGFPESPWYQPPRKRALQALSILLAAPKLAVTLRRRPLPQVAD